jgi:spermidine synthase
MTNKKSGKGYWITEWFTPHECHKHHIKQSIVDTKTRFQKAQLADTHSFGRCLILDGEMQSAEMDEFIYHECLVHPALLMHPKPQDVLILGGGEGATTREILKHKSVRRCVMVDIDGEVVRFCKKFLTPWHQGAFQNPRSHVIIGDAKAFVETTDEKFDVIISDLPTPIEAGPAYMLYTIEFYKTLVKKLKPGGIFVLQAGSGNLLQFKVHSVLHNTLSKVFKRVSPFYAYVPSFDVPWAFLLCGGADCDPLALSDREVDASLKKKITGDLKFYDGLAHMGIFRIPKYLRDELKKEKQVMTEKRPIFFLQIKP